MATALDMLKRSMRLIGALGAGEDPTAAEGADGLSALNNMLDAWWAKTLAVYYTQDETFSWAAGQSVRTMGSGGNFATTRPARITGAYQRLSSSDYPIEILRSRAEYDSLVTKSTGSDLITKIYPEMRAALVYLYAYPVPSTTAEVHIQSLARLQSFAGLSTNVSLPPGYQRAIEYNLALEIAPEYQVQIPPLVMTNAASSLRGIKRANFDAGNTGTEAGILGSSRHLYDYRTGE